MCNTVMKTLTFIAFMVSEKMQMLKWGVWGVQTEIAPLTSGGSIPWDGREHWFSSDIHLSLMAPRSFLSNTLETAFACGRNLERG